MEAQILEHRTSHSHAKSRNSFEQLDYPYKRLILLPDAMNIKNEY